MKWNSEKNKKMYERIKKEAIERGIDKNRLESPYLDKLSKDTKSSRIMGMINEAYYLGMLRGIKYVDEMQTPITLRNQLISSPPSYEYLELVDIDTAGNVIILHFFDSAKNEKVEEEVHVDYNAYVLTYDDLDMEYEDVKLNKCPLFVVNNSKIDEWYPDATKIAAMKSSHNFYYREKYSKIMNVLNNMKFEQKEFPDNKKIIDFEKHGNQIKFLLGNLDCNDYHGDDWNDYPYEHNAGSVYDEYITGEWIVSFPFNWVIQEPCEGYLNSPYCKLDMRDKSVPCIAYLEDCDEYFENFGELVLRKNCHKIYFNDTKETIDI